MAEDTPCATASMPLPCPSETRLPVGDAVELSLPRLLAVAFRESGPVVRARLLECLIRPLRPLGLAAAAAGAFASFLHRESWSGFTVPVEAAARYSAEQIFELATYVEQSAPEALVSLGGLVADHQLMLASPVALLVAWVALRLQGAERAPSSAEPVAVGATHIAIDTEPGTS
jgi:hypothetical protein